MDKVRSGKVRAQLMTDIVGKSELITEHSLSFVEVEVQVEVEVEVLRTNK
jgi:hypothetical protein